MPDFMNSFNYQVFGSRLAFAPLSAFSNLFPIFGKGLP